MSKERFEQRLFRIFAQAGYSPVRILTVTPEEMVEIPGVTVPEIRAGAVRPEQSAVRAEHPSQWAADCRADEGSTGKRGAKA